MKRSPEDQIAQHVGMVSHYGRTVLLPDIHPFVVDYFRDNKEYILEPIDKHYVVTTKRPHTFSSRQEAENFLVGCYNRKGINKTRLGQEIINSLCTDRHVFITEPSIYYELNEDIVVEWFYNKLT